VENLQVPKKTRTKKQKKKVSAFAAQQSDRKKSIQEQKAWRGTDTVAKLCRQSTPLLTSHRH
jgi:hypothetical protein